MKNLYIFIVNPVSGNGKGSKTWDKLQSKLKEKKIKYLYFFTEYTGHSIEICTKVLQEYKKSIKAVVAIGGDGTIHEICNGLRSDSNIAIGYIPSGTGNDFARGYNIPNDPIKALELILSSPSNSLKRYDVGHYKVLGKESIEVKGAFVNAVAVGFDGAVTKMANTSIYKAYLNKLGLGGIIYSLTAIKMILAYQPHNIILEIDGDKYELQDVWLAAVSNIAYYGGGLLMAPKAKLDDGKLNVCVIHGVGKLKLLLVFLCIFMGKHYELEGVTVFEGETLEITSDTKMIIAVDGEIVGHTPIAIGVDKRFRPYICQGSNKNEEMYED